ncbi:hypothetical protein ERO13_D13G132350v2 [Gossypium hirsutum]|uniref:Uncharacterized protein n=3 Tax=Gossypium TaxID=3633 RepID=A0A5J5NM21_GOSBA|nr:hypothetical protein ES319_D13G150800v1 [Gossypium barbadense]KAG4111934.1 hypothetical protein ERO13_D13G132350v2 [Gossypium hirsutum]TYG37686.1 hypothetical protein ES288_D13G161300v1 [Gossypium darwinii]TYI47164.1 hypothetical protein E1A91_D13G153900v1 [Gossypium mustelinum]
MELVKEKPLRNESKSAVKAIKRRRRPQRIQKLSQIQCLIIYYINCTDLHNPPFPPLRSKRKKKKTHPQIKDSRERRWESINQTTTAPNLSRIGERTQENKHTP